MFFLPQFVQFFSFFAPPFYLTSDVFLSSLVLTLSSYLVRSFSHLIDFVLLSAVVLHLVVVVAAAEEAVELRRCQ